MQDRASSPPPPNRPAGDATLAAVTVQGVQVMLKASYSKLLKEMIFRYPPAGFDRKQLAAFVRTLNDEQTQSILALIWQNSAPVSGYPSAAGTVRRDKSGHLTSHGLAVELAEVPKDLAKINSRIRKIGIAAEAYGLVKRNDVHKNKIYLEATPLLHEFFLTLSESNISTARKLRLLIEQPAPALDTPPGLAVQRSKK